MLDSRFCQAVAEAHRTLMQHRLRTLLSGLGIVIGVASISAVLAMGDGLEAFAREQIARSTSVLNVALSPQRFRTVDGERQPIREEDRFVFDAAGLDVLTAPTIRRPTSRAARRARPRASPCRRLPPCGGSCPSS